MIFEVDIRDTTTGMSVFLVIRTIVIVRLTFSRKKEQLS